MKIDFLVNGAKPDPYLGVFNGYIQEAVNTVTYIELFVVSDFLLSEEELEEFIGSPATVKLSEPIDGERKVSRFDGLIFDIRELNPYGARIDDFLYKIIIRPSIWKLTLSSRARSFLNQSRTEVVDKILKEGGFQSGIHFETKYFSEKNYPKMSQLLQCEISDWAFIRQLLTEAGINFSFHAKKDGATNEMMHLVDNNGYYQKPLPEPLKWNPSANMVAERHIAAFETHVRSIPASVQAVAAFGDGKTRTFESEVTLDKGTGYDYHVFSAEGQTDNVAKHRAQIFADGFEANRISYEGKSNHFLIRSGEKFELKCSRYAIEKKILVTSVKHYFVQDIGHAAAEQTELDYRNEFTAVREKAEIRPVANTQNSHRETGLPSPAFDENDASKNPLIPLLSEKKSDIDADLVTAIDHLTRATNSFGIMLGKVVEDAKVSAGNEMTCKIANERFPDGIIAKVSIAWLVPGGGCSALPRAGMEVYFTVVQGLGGQHEAVVLSYRPSGDVKGQDPAQSKDIKTVVPGDKPGEAVKVDSVSPSNRNRVGMTGEGGAAEVTILDGDGSISLHANANILLVSDADTSMSSANHMHMSGAVSEQYDSINRVVGGDVTEEIGGNRSLKLTGNDTNETSGNEEKKIGGTRKIEVKGMVTDKIDGPENKTVKGPRKVDMKAGHVETITGVASTTVKGAMSVSVKAASTEKVKGSKSVSVKGDMKEQVKGNVIIDTKGSYAVGAKKDAGFKVDGNMNFEVKKKVTIKCGSAQIVVEKNGNVTIKGKKLTQKFSGDVAIKGKKVNIN